jgi:serine protease Do
MRRLLSYLLFSVTLLLVVDLHLSGPTKERFVKVVDKVLPAVVEIHVEGYMTAVVNGYPVSRKVGVLGSGVFIAKNGYILTCAHLFRDFTKISKIVIIASNDDTTRADIIKVSPTADLAIIKAGFYKDNPTVKLANPLTLKVGQEVIAIGSPLGLSFSVTTGVISALSRDIGDNYNTTQSDAAINPGNSGGPMFNLKGQLIGVNVFMISDNELFPTFSGLGFSEQCGEIIRFLADVKKVEKGLVL